MSSAKVTTTVRNTFTQEELVRFKELFTTHDSNHDGRVDADELLNLTKSVGEAPSPEILEFALKSFDTDGDKAFDFDEFILLMATLRDAGNT